MFILHIQGFECHQEVTRRSRAGRVIPKMHRPRQDKVHWTSSCLDSSGCLTLRQIVGSFSAPITEEHAWAVIYEAVRTLDICLSNPSMASKLNIASSLTHVRLHESGYAHDSTFIVNPDKGNFVTQNARHNLLR